MRNTLKTVFNSNYWHLCQNSCSWNMFWKETKESLAGSLRNIFKVAVPCWYTNDAFAGFCQDIFEEKNKLQKTF